MYFAMFLMLVGVNSRTYYKQMFLGGGGGGDCNTACSELTGISKELTWSTPTYPGSDGICNEWTALSPKSSQDPLKSGGSIYQLNLPSLSTDNGCKYYSFGGSGRDKICICRTQCNNANEYLTFDDENRYKCAVCDSGVIEKGDFIPEEKCVTKEDLKDELKTRYNELVC